MGRPNGISAAVAESPPVAEAGRREPSPHPRSGAPFWPSGLDRRRREPEVMESPDLDPALHRRALADLAWLNRLNRIAGRYWREIRRHAEGRRAAGEPGPLRLLDVACGGGDLAVALGRRAARAGVPLTVDGCDLRPLALEEASGRARRAGVDGRFFRLDVLRDPFPEGYDVVMSSHFLHHLDDAELVGLLRRTAAASRLVLMGDLLRGRLGYLLAWLGSRLLVRSPVVWNDAPRSVAASFTAGEALRLAGRAGLDGARIVRHWPERYLLVWERG